MKTCHSLIFFFLATLQDGNTCLVGVSGVPAPQVLRASEGGNITMTCFYEDPEGNKIFCRDECKDGDILVETTGVKAQRGRFSLEYEEQSLPVSYTHVYMSISNLRKSDSGRYSCAGHLLAPHVPQVFELTVEEVPTTPQPTRTSGFFPTSNPPPSSLEMPPWRPSGVELYVRLGLVLVIIVSSAALLISCRTMFSKSSGLQRDRVCEEV